MKTVAKGGLGLLVVSVALSGCLLDFPSGHNPSLAIQNDSPNAVTLHIPTERRYLHQNSDGENPVFNDSISIPAKSNRSIRMFEADDQYEVTIQMNAQSVSFSTRPICSKAVTNVTITETGRLTYFVEFCEGGPTEGSARPSPTE